MAIVILRICNAERTVRVVSEITLR